MAGRDKSQSKEEGLMVRIVGFHRFALKPGVDASTFEKFVREDVFPGLGIVFAVDKTITHEFTLANWLNVQHVLLRTSQGGAAGDYLWLITTNVDDEKLTTQEGRFAVDAEAQDKVDEFYTLGHVPSDIAKRKLEPFVMRTSSGAFLEVFQLSPPLVRAFDVHVPVHAGGFCPTPQKGTFQQYAPLIARDAFV
jgi:hypothetical protein